MNNNTLGHQHYKHGVINKRKQCEECRRIHANEKIKHGCNWKHGFERIKLPYDFNMDESNQLVPKFKMD